jgi:hypothetical protein
MYLLAVGPKGLSPEAHLLREGSPAMCRTELLIAGLLHQDVQLWAEEPRDCR